MRLSSLLLITGLIACAEGRVAVAQPWDTYPRGNQPYSLSVVDEWNRELPTFHHHGQLFVLGQKGQRYLLRVRNHMNWRIEVVASVDGRDVMDGQRAAWHKRGYIVNPYGELLIDGYRMSTESVAAFRFSSVRDSYAAQTGSARDVGVIGVAVFRERYPHHRVPQPFPRPPRPSEPYSLAPDRLAPEASGKASPPSSPQAERRRSDGDSSASRRPGLGTEFGEEHGSPVEWVRFNRAGSRPDSVLTVRYDDRRGLSARGIDVDGHGYGYIANEQWLRDTAEPFRGEGNFARPPPGWRR